jgi:uncharacterized protein (DUF4415 family)
VTGKNIRRASLAEIEKMHEDGLLYDSADAPEGPDLGDEFWANAKLVEPMGVRSVHLKLDEDVFQFFKQKGKGHLTRMQAVLRAYVNAHR